MICDLHNDFLTAPKNDNEKIKYLNSLSKVEKVACTVYTTELANPFEHILHSKKLIDENNDKNNLILAIEDLGFLQDDQTEELLKINPLYCSLTWNYQNDFASGCLENGGLTKKGEKLVRTLEENNVLTDLAHLNEESFYDVAKVSKKPLFCSHCACYSRINNKRNLKDEQIKNIAKSGGLLGIFFVGKFISKNKPFTSYDIAKHIAHIAEKFGTSIIALGSDFYGTSDLPSDIKNYDDFINLKFSLKSLGFDNAELDKIFHKNFINFLRQQNA